MTNTITVAEWLNHVDREYLTTFIKDGGAAVKFAVCAEDGRQDLGERLKIRCEERKHLFVTLDAIESRVHMPQDVFFFFGLALQIDWPLLARHVILRLLSEKAYRIDGIDPKGTFNIIDAVAEANRIDSQSVLFDLRPSLEEEVTKNPNMARAFRVAMTHLCHFERDSGRREEYRGKPLLDWLTGTNIRIGNVKPFQVHTSINRTTARYFIESALYWIRHAGYSGTVILLNNARVTLPRNPRDGMRFYTRAMTMDHYELLREFIDDVDRLAGSLLVVLTDYAFVDDQSTRGWAIYPALRTREAALVRLL